SGPGVEVRDRGRIECGDEGELQEDVDGGPDDDGADHRSWEVALWVRAFAAELYGLFEAEEGKDDAASGYADENGLCPDVEPTRDEEPAACGEVAAVEVRDEQGNDGQHRDQHLPGGETRVEVGQPADAHQVDVREHHHQHDGCDDPAAAQRPIDRPGDGRLVPGARPRDGREVLDGRQHLDGGDGGCLDVGEPPERATGKAAERVVREAARTT